ncbi:MAG: L,D-transpeptidase family protein [Segetibacter sp.]
MKYILYAAGIMMTLLSCNGGAPKKTLPVIARDTTIQPQVAFTLLRLDSNAVENFLDKEVKNDSTKSKITGFYNARNYQYAWFTEDGLSESGEAFWNLHQKQERGAKDTSNEDRRLHLAVQTLLNDEEAKLNKDSVKKIELDLTVHFFEYVKTAFGGKVNPEDLQWHIPRRKLNAAALLDSFLAGGDKDWQPLNPSFYQLQGKLKLYASVVKAGGWSEINSTVKKLKKGQSNTAITAVKKRLQVSGDFAGADTSQLFTPALYDAVKNLQTSFGLKEDGIITTAFLDRLNVPAEERMQQMLINLERMRWLPEPQPDRIVANIPEYKLHVYESGKEVLAMNIVVGKAANRTVIFSDVLEYVVFSPYWNVPRSIVRNEIVPAMNRNSNYIGRNNMEITGYSNGLPIVRQKPGGGNALGKVKFIFPNGYNIYLHDTPAKTLFNKESRAFSHGCVRVQEPFTLAQYLLRNNKAWTESKIKKAMNSQKEDWVKLDKPLPVYLLYLTSWVDEDGVLNFRDDIYGHDKKLGDRLFTADN